MPLDPAETSSSLSFSPVTLSLTRGSRVSASLSHPSGSLFLQSQCCFCKIHISSFRDPNEVIPILLGSRMSLVFNKNMKHAMFLHK